MASKDIKAQRLAALLGLDVPIPPSPIELKERDEAQRSAQAAYIYAIEPTAFMERKCINCERLFAVNRKYITHCSERCLMAALAEMGIDWNPDPEHHANRWTANRAGPEPLTVEPEALEVLHSLGFPQVTIPQNPVVLQPLPAPSGQSPAHDDSLDSILATDDYDVLALLDGL